MTQRDKSPIDWLRAIARHVATHTSIVAFAQSVAQGVTALNPETFAAVRKDIDALVATPPWLEERFVPSVATPRLIEQLFSDTELLATLRPVECANALVLAGREPTSLLTFDKPSDVITKVALWFPEEIAVARSKQRHMLGRSDVHLHGPHLSWTDEAIAFVVLWNCMPNGAWMRPQLSPFAIREQGDSLPGKPLAAQGSGPPEEYDFAYCVRERNRPQFPFDPVSREANIAYGYRIADRVTPVLRRKFAWFLSQNRCLGTGPDDCALILLQWAKLSPTDMALAAALQALETDVGFGQPLPPRAPTVQGLGGRTR